jgi:hypothetical protein
VKEFLKINLVPFLFGVFLTFSILSYLLGVLGQRASMLDQRLDLVLAQEKALTDLVNSPKPTFQPKKTVAKSVPNLEQEKIN